MRIATVLAALPALAFASLNCTIIAPTVTQRYCEWEGCQPYATVTAGQIIHAGCRADCSTESEPWFQLYDGSFIKATNDTLEKCRYHCKPYAVTGLPYCFQEKANFTASPLSPTVCPISSAAGLASKVPAPKTLGIEPPPFPSIISLCSLTPSPKPTPAPKMWKA